MIAFYDNQPTKLEAVGNGSYVYRFNIKQVEKPVQETPSEVEPISEPQVQCQCEEVTVWSPITSNKITEAVITDKWDNNQEQKLVNEFNGANLGIYGAAKSAEAQKKIDAYKAYLSERSALKTQVDKDCAELGIK
jgi:hypothetical protein